MQFVDPDAPPEAAEVYGGEESLDDLVTGPAAATVDEAALDAIRTMRLENIVLQARGSAAEIECMRAHVAALQGMVRRRGVAGGEEGLPGANVERRLLELASTLCRPW